MARYLFVLGSILLFLKRICFQRKKSHLFSHRTVFRLRCRYNFSRTIIPLSSIIIGISSIPGSRSQTIHRPLLRKQAVSFNNLKESGNKEIITATPHPPVQEQSSRAVTALREGDLLLLIIEPHKRQRIMVLIYCTGNAKGDLYIRSAAFSHKRL